MTRTRNFPRVPESVAGARRFATQALKGVDADLLDAVTLMVSELATTCVRHTRTSFAMTVSQRRGQIRVEVSDRSGGTPAMRSPGPEEPSGRGLQIVNMLSDAWGVEPGTAAGKTVWFTVGGSAA
jgi:anti-sigma regulatory factor (Ser/Thr protein kinase)